MTWTGDEFFLNFSFQNCLKFSVHGGKNGIGASVMMSGKGGQRSFIILGSLGLCAGDVITGKKRLTLHRVTIFWVCFRLGKKSHKNYGIKDTQKNFATF